jgi:hypothetical protein
MTAADAEELHHRLLVGGELRDQHTERPDHQGFERFDRAQQEHQDARVEADLDASVAAVQHHRELRDHEDQRDRQQLQAGHRRAFLDDDHERVDEERGTGEEDAEVEPAAARVEQRSER